jgi:hypothetical protein
MPKHLCNVNQPNGDCSVTVVKGLRYKSEGHWFYSRWCHWNFLMTLILLIALWPWGRLSLQQKWVHGVFPGGKGGRCVRMTNLPPYCAVVKKSGNLKFLEPSGPLQACNGTTLPFIMYVLYILFSACQLALFGYPDWGFFHAFSSVVRQMPVYNSQRRGTARTLLN